MKNTMKSVPSNVIASLNWVRPTTWILTVLVASTSMAQSYQEAIQNRTLRNTGVEGKWYELTTADWVFYEGEAATGHNMGAIQNGMKVEVIKWNRHMARVRLPDGRVVFIRNRLLKETSAPSTSEKAQLAAKTAVIGKDALAEKDPYQKPTATDLSEIAAAPQASPVPRPRPATPAPAVAPTGGRDQTADTTIAPSGAIPLPNQSPAARPEVKPAAPTADTTVAPSGAAVSPLPVPPLPVPPAGESPAPARPATPAVAKGDATPAGAAPAKPRPQTPVTAPPGPAAPTAPKADKEKPGADGKPMVLNPNLKKLYNGEMCDPKKNWQSPLRQTYRVVSCIGNERDGGSRLHAGVDIGGEEGGMRNIPIFPIASGKVIRSGFAGGYGCLVIVQHDSCPKQTGRPFNSQKCTSRYAHMATKKKNGETVCDVPAENTKVTTCDQIGRLSGTGSNGGASDYVPHLHFEMRDDSESVVFNPNLALKDLRTSDKYKSSGSVSCSKTKGVLAINADPMNRGRLDVRLTSAAIENEDGVK